MRKIIAILVGLLMLFSIPALGEEFSFSNLTMDELVDLYSEFMKEFQTRIEEQYSSSLIYEGVYLAGEDLRPGRYQFICIEKDAYTASFGIYSPTESGQETYTCDYVKYLTNESSLPIYFTIEESQKFDLRNCYGVLIPADLEDKPSWQP